MVHSAIPMIALPQVRCMFVYYTLESYCTCVAFVVKEVVSFLGLSQLMGVAHKKNARSLAGRFGKNTA